MTRGEAPAGPAWSDPAVGAGFAAAYEPQVWPPRAGDLGDDAPVVPQSRPAADEPLRDEGSAEPPAADEPSSLTRDGRRPRAPRPARLSPARAVAGAAVSVCGVLLGIGTLLWVTDDPQGRSGPTVEVPVSEGALADDGATADGLAAPPAETEQVPVDPPAVVLPPAPAPVPPPAPAAVAPAPAAKAPVRSRPSLVVPVTVLNNSNRTGLADRAAARFERGGWPVRLTGNFRGQIPVTTVYYDPGLEANARSFARTFDGIVRVRPRFATLPARGVVVVLTREFAG